MPLSRLYRHKDVISRTKNLARGGIFLQGKEPKWLSVALRFPPYRMPALEVYRPKAQLGKMIYPEDGLRDLFYRTYDFPNEPIVLFASEDKARPMVLCEKYVKLQVDLMKEENLSEKDSQPKVEKLMAEIGERLVRKDSLRDEYQR